MTVTRYINEGLALARQGELRQAALLLCLAVKLDPDRAEAYRHLGEVLIPLQRWEDAEACFFRAVALQPHFPEAHNYLGVVLNHKKDLSGAEACYQRAIGQNPGYAEAYHNLGSCFKQANRIDEAEACYRRALELQPDLRDSRFSLATLYLLRGEYELGWQLHESRWQGDFRLDIPLWQGEDLTGCKILLFFEQGYGDMLQFVRYAYIVAKQAAVTVWIQKPLKRLLAGSQTAFSVCTGRTLPEESFDYACSLLSLPFHCKTSLATIPNDVPYLHAGAEITARWRDKIDAAAGGRCRVGVVWAGNPEHSDDANRSIAFALFGRLFSVEGIAFFSLQAGGKSRQLPSLPSEVFDCCGQLADFAETAGVIANLDLVIAVDTAVAHLAGAMGKKTWLLLPFKPDWRWGLDREDSPWYPTMRLFRQRQPGDWQEVLERVAAALHRRIKASAQNTAGS
ncbi:MAG: tetratricopeptide repeat protein [Negativicutes bacterium]|nr:tetratricopeptide repeat protein [Negativicutes bacterium]